MSNSSFTGALGLGSPGISGNIISSQAGELRIIGRYPERGLPKSGVPFSLDVEVDIYRTFWNSVLYVSCPDVVVAALDPQTRGVLALSRITTSMRQGCRGQSRLVFPRLFRPDPSHPVIFELHKSNVTEANAGSAKPMARSKVMTLDLGIEDGQQGGIYSLPTKPWYHLELPGSQGAISGLNKSLSKMLWLIGLGAGVYFMAPLMPGMRDSIKQLGQPSKKSER